MSGPRFLEIARGIISQCGVDVKAATATKFNRFRRFLPTGVQVLNLHPQDCQAIGSWVEMPEQEAPPLLRQWVARTSCLLITQVSVSWLACVPNPLLCKQCCNMRWQCRCRTRRCLPTPLGARGFRVLGLAPPQLLQMARKICRFPAPALPKFRSLRHPQRTREAPPRQTRHTSVSWMRLRGFDSVRRFMLCESVTWTLGRCLGVVQLLLHKIHRRRAMVSRRTLHSIFVRSAFGPCREALTKR